MSTAQQLRNEGHAKGRQEGRKEGRNEGLNEGRMETLVTLLAARFGPLDPQTTRVIQQASPAQINTWIQRFATGANTDSITDIIH